MHSFCPRKTTQTSSPYPLLHKDLIPGEFYPLPCWIFGQLLGARITMTSHGESSWRLALGDFAPSQTASEECGVNSGMHVSMILCYGGTVVMFSRSQELLTVSSLDIPKSSKYFGPPKKKSRNSSRDIFQDLYGHGDPTVVKLHRIQFSWISSEIVVPRTSPSLPNTLVWSCWVGVLSSHTSSRLVFWKARDRMI